MTEALAERRPSERVLATWQWYELGEVCRTTSGGTPSRKNPGYFEGSIPWVKSGELPDGPVLEIAESISEDALRESSAKLFPPGTLLVALYGATVGKLGVLTRPAATNQAVCAIFPPPIVDTKFLFWFLRSSREALISQAVGGAQPNISQGVIRSLRIPVPPLDEQREIVAEIEKQFSRLDEAVVNLLRVKANLKRFTSSVLAEAVAGRLVAAEADIARDDGRAFAHAAEDLGRILAARGAQGDRRGKRGEPIPPVGELVKVPTGWCWSTVDQLAQVGTGATPNRSKPAYYEGGNVPWVTSSVVNAPYVDQASEFVTPVALEQTNLTLYPPGTLLVAMYGEGKTRGKCTELRIAAATNQALAALRVDAAVRPYLKLFLEHNYEATRKVASGGVQPNLNLSLVRAIKVPLPPLAERLRIVAEVDRRLSIVREVEADVDTNLKRAQALRQSILSAAFAMRNPRETMAAL